MTQTRHCGKEVDFFVDRRLVSLVYRLASLALWLRNKECLIFGIHGHVLR